jgi:hypothetical protein
MTTGIIVGFNFSAASLRSELRFYNFSLFWVGAGALAKHEFNKKDDRLT